MHTISEVCQQTSLSSRTLRVWEEAKLVSSERNDSGMRQYHSNIYDKIERIQLAISEWIQLYTVSIGECPIVGPRAPLPGSSPLMKATMSILSTHCRYLSIAFKLPSIQA